MTPDHLTIGAFSRLTGLTPSALRFYDDAGLLPPADVDDSSGYRYYSPTQTSTAQLIRQLRETGMSLGDIRTILDDPDPATTGRRIDDHVAYLTEQLAEATAAAHRVKSSIGAGSEARDAAVGVAVSGPLFATAGDAVVQATVVNPELPVLDSVLIEVADRSLTLTATDRYRLASRSLGLPASAAGDWVATVPADSFRSLLGWARRNHRISLHRTVTEVVAVGDVETRRWPASATAFPDYRLMLRSLPPALTRAVVSRRALLDALEHAARHTIVRVDDEHVVVGDVTVPAAVTGQPITIGFDVTVLYPTVAAAIGADVMLDFAADDLPVRVRSADDGDLITLAMPVKVAK